MNTIQKPKMKSITTDLTVDRLWILSSFVISILTIALLIYMSLNRGRVDVVYLSDDKFDAPMLLDKVATTKDAIRADRYVKGMVRRFISNYFVSPEMTAEEAKDAIRWTIVHTGEKGRTRGKAIINDFDSYQRARMSKWAAFKPLLDDNSVTIKRSSMSDDRYLVTVPGTYVSQTRDGENFASGVLRMIIVSSGVSGIPDRDAGGIINATGLEVESSTVLLQTGSDAPTVIELF